MYKILTILLVISLSIQAQVPATITYQGSLEHLGSIADGVYDFEFKLYDELAEGTGVQQGDTVFEQLTVSDGVFSANLDFGTGVFNGFDLFLEIAVKETANPSYTVLSPRQPFSSVPYAHKAESADSVPPNSIGSVEINSSQVQQRISNGCAVGSTINAINEDGSVVCEVDDGLTSVTGSNVVDGSLTGVDIEDLTITALDIKNNSISNSKIGANAVTSEKIANGTIEYFDTNTRSVQRRVSGSCSEGSSIRIINFNGGVTCSPAGLTSVTGGDVVDGSLTGVDLNSSLNLTGTLTWNCPTGTTRVGNWCMDNRYRSPRTGVSSLTQCHNVGMQLCPLEALLTCDAANVGTSNNTSCRGLTDCVVDLPIRTSTTGALAPSGSSFNNMIEYKGCGNETDIVGDLTERVYFCCKPVSG